MHSPEFLRYQLGPRSRKPLPRNPLFLLRRLILVACNWRSNAMGVRIGPAARPDYYKRDPQAREAAVGRSPWLEMVSRGYLWETCDTERAGSCEEAAAEILSGVAARTSGARAKRWAIDVTVDVPKPISLGWAIGDGAMTRAIELSHDEATDVIVQGILGLPLDVRLGAGGRTRVPADPVIFRARHVVARPVPIGDLGLVAAPHLHQQLLVAVLARRPDYGLSALDLGPLFRARTHLEAVHARALSDALARHGVPVKPHPRHGLQLDCVSEALVDLASGRRQGLCDLAAALSCSSHDKAVRLYDAIRTRRPKSELPLADILEIWRELSRTLKVDVTALVSPAPQPPAVTEVDLQVIDGMQIEDAEETLDSGWGFS